ncbi:MAG: GIY-YIG nuclease family protein [Gemmatimonadaceae bacterium]
MNRKEAIRAYKEARRPMGVYQVRNTVSGKVYLGTSVDLPSILNRERAQLRLGAHRDRRLQADWKALGDGAFAFEVLDTLEPPEDPGYDPADDLRTLEDLWRGKLAAAGTEAYNPPRRR